MSSEREFEDCVDTQNQTSHSPSASKGGEEEKQTEGKSSDHPLMISLHLPCWLNYPSSVLLTRVSSFQTSTSKSPMGSRTHHQFRPKSLSLQTKPGRRTT